MRWCMTRNPQAWSNLSECAFGLSVWNSLIWNTSQTGWLGARERASAMERLPQCCQDGEQQKMSASFEGQLPGAGPLAAQIQRFKDIFLLLLLSISVNLWGFSLWVNLLLADVSHVIKDFFSSATTRQMKCFNNEHDERDCYELWKKQSRHPQSGLW